MILCERRRLLDALLAAVTAAVTAAIFGWVAVKRRSGATMRFDLAVRGRVHQSASPALTLLARGLATVGSPRVLPLLFAIAIAMLHHRNWKRAALTLTAVMVGAVIAEVGLKRLFHSARPEPFFGTEPSSYSFPSGHAFFSLSFYGVLAGAFAAHTPPGVVRFAVLISAALLVAGIGWSRVYLGVHYPSDVLAGYLGGIFVISAVLAVWPGGTG